MNKNKLIKNANILLMIVALLLTFFVINIVNPEEANKEPDNNLIHKHLVIPNTGKYSTLYVDEIKKDRGSQQIGLSVEMKGKDLHIYAMAHKTSENQLKEYTKWLVSYYGAEEINH